MRKNVPCPTYDAVADTRITITASRYPLKARNPAAKSTLSPSKNVRIKIAMYPYRDINSSRVPPELQPPINQKRLEMTGAKKGMLDFPASPFILQCIFLRIFQIYCSLSV